MPHPTYADPRVGPLLVTSVATSVDLSRAEVRLTGELDGSESGSLDAVLDGLLREGYRRIVVDLAGLRFLACAGLTVFVRAHSRAGGDGARVQFTRPTPMITRILRITDLDLVLDVRADAYVPAAQRSSAARDATRS